MIGFYLLNLFYVGRFLRLLVSMHHKKDLMSQVSVNFGRILDEIVQIIPNREKLFIGGDLNGHVGTSRHGFDSVHGGFSFGERNKPGNSILDFALSYDLILANT